MNRSEEYDIEQLMLTKAFEALSDDERKTVLATMDQDAYAQQRNLLLDYQGMFSAEHLPEPDAALIHQLKQANQATTTTPGWLALFLDWLERPLPAYQLAIVPLLLIAVVFFLWPDTKPLPPTERLVTQVVHDTVEVIREVEVPVEVAVERIVYVSQPATALPTVAEEEDAEIVMLPSSVPDPKELERSLGNTGLKQEALEQLRAWSYLEGG